MGMRINSASPAIKRVANRIDSLGEVAAGDTVPYMMDHLSRYARHTLTSLGSASDIPPEYHLLWSMAPLVSPQAMWLMPLSFRNNGRLFHYAVVRAFLPYSNRYGTFSHRGNHAEVAYIPLSAPPHSTYGHNYPWMFASTTCLPSIEGGSSSIAPWLCQPDPVSAIDHAWAERLIEEDVADNLTHWQPELAVWSERIFHGLSLVESASRNLSNFEVTLMFLNHPEVPPAYRNATLRTDQGYTVEINNITTDILHSYKYLASPVVDMFVRSATPGGAPTFPIAPQ